MIQHRQSKLDPEIDQYESFSFKELIDNSSNNFGIEDANVLNIFKKHFNDPIFKFYDGAKPFDKNIKAYVYEDKLKYNVMGCYNKNFFIPYSQPSLAHEISHLIEMQNPNRWVMNDFGMPLNLSTKTPPLAGAVRELRTLSIQKHFIDPKGGHQRLVNNFYASKIYEDYWDQNLGMICNKRRETILVNAAFFIAQVGQHMPFGKMRSIKDFQEWRDLILENTKKQYNLDRIDHDLGIRIEYIKNHLETNHVQT
jgi:hypothetical protein